MRVSFTVKNRLILDPTPQIPESRTWSLANWAAYSWAPDDSGLYLVSQHALNCRSSGCNSQTSSGYALTTDCKSGYELSRCITEGCIVSFVCLFGLSGMSRLMVLARTNMPLIELRASFQSQRSVKYASTHSWGSCSPHFATGSRWFSKYLRSNPSRVSTFAYQIQYTSSWFIDTINSQPSSTRQYRRDHDSCILHQPRAKSAMT